MNELISIIVPIYNSDKYLDKCINSIIGQTYRNTQLILVNDGSIDNSLSICLKYSKEHSNILIVNQDNKGVSSARNAGLNLALSKYIVFIDSDDYIESNMCQCFINDIRKNDADLVISGFSLFNNGMICPNIILPENNEIINLEYFNNKFDKYFERGLISSPCNKIYKKSLIKNSFNEQLSLGEDLIFNLDYLSQCQTISTIRNSFYNYRINQKNSLSSKYKRDGFEIAIKLFTDSCKFGNVLWGEKFNSNAITNKFISDICTNSENLVRFSGLSFNKIRKILEDYFNDKVIEENFEHFSYHESTKYEVYKFLLKHKQFYLFFLFSDFLSKIKR